MLLDQQPDLWREIKLQPGEQVLETANRIAREILVPHKDELVAPSLVLRDYIIQDPPQKNGLVDDVLVSLGVLFDLLLKGRQMVPHELRLSEEVVEREWPVQSLDAAGEGGGMPD